MEKQTALHIIQALAQGIDPHSGEAFPTDSPYQHPDTVRALFQAVQALTEPSAARPRPATPHGAPTNAGKPWTAMKTTYSPRASMPAAPWPSSPPNTVAPGPQFRRAW